MLGQQYGFPVPVGGAGRLTDALVSRLRSRGGSVVFDAPVDRVVVGAGRALGVRVAGGRYWRARRAVLADVPAPALYRDLVGADHLPARFVADLGRFRWDNATAQGRLGAVRAGAVAAPTRRAAPARYTWAPTWTA